MDRNLTNSMYCWNPGGDIQVVDWPDAAGTSDTFEMTGGACWAHIRESTFEQRKCMAFIDAMTMIVRDGCDPASVHREMLKLEEYNDGCPQDARS